jgi:hypothetical protein
MAEVNLNVEEQIINKALKIIEDNPIEHSNFEPEEGLTLADALTVIIMDGEDHDTDMESHKVYDFLDERLG